MSVLSDRIRRMMPAPRPPANGPVQAVWNGTVLATSDRTIVVNGNHYFLPEHVNPEYLVPAAKQTSCPWKGTASYYDVVVGDERNRAAAWYYPDPRAAAARIADHVAFWHGVKVTRATSA